METQLKVGGREKFAFGIGAIGKDMMYMFSASYVLYYFQSVMGVSAVAMGIILMAARVFDAFNDPIMGLIVAKTKNKMGRFRPWILFGTLSNAIVLIVMFNCPPDLSPSGLVAYAAVTYVIWGMTYTMMDIPFWSIVPAFTGIGKDREDMSAIGRACAAIGSGIVSMGTVWAVKFLGSINNNGSDYQRLGYLRVAIIISAIFVVFTLILCMLLKEQSTVDVEVPTFGEMVKALVRNDQTMAVVVSIVCINTALYITSNLVIYFFRYDFSPLTWENNFTYFNIAGGVFQLLAMIVIYPLLRKVLSSTKIFHISFWMAMIGYLILLAVSYFHAANQYIILLPAFLIFSAMGMLNIVVTVLLADTVDYGEMKNDHRDESVIFSMQTFVVKLASGIAGLAASLTLWLFDIENPKNTMKEVGVDTSGNIAYQMEAAKSLGFELVITLVPIIILVIGLIVFAAKYKLNDEMLKQVEDAIIERRQMKRDM